MRDQDSLLAAIRDNPDDDAVRLVYADWLEENGDPDRAEFIRVQCQLAKGCAGQRREELAAREEELLERHKARWIGPLKGKGVMHTFERGFLVQASMTAQHFFKHAERIFKVAPALRSLRLRRVTAEMCTDIAACPHLAQIQVLNLEENSILLAGVRALAASPHLARLTELELGNTDLGDMAVEEMAAAWPWRQLRRLSLYSNLLTGDALRALARCAGLAGLRDLELGGNRIGWHAMEEFASSAHLRHLEYLGLSNNGVGNQGAAALARSPHLAGLDCLGLSYAVIGDAGARELIRSPHLGRLELWFVGNSVSAQTEAALEKRFILQD